MTASRAAAIAIVAAMAVAAAGCASHKEKARDAAIDDMRAHLSEITDTASDLIKAKNPQRVSARVQYLYGADIYKHSATDTEASWIVVLTDDASYSEFIGAHQVVIGTCIAMTATRTDGVDTTTIDCPDDIWKSDTVASFNQEVDILDN